VAIIVLLLLPWVLLRSWTAPLYFASVSVLVVAVMLIPIQGFREIGSMLFVGLLLDTLVARPFLIPALVALFGRDRSPKRNSAPKGADSQLLPKPGTRLELVTPSLPWKCSTN
jgi:hypothetical protein